MFMLSPIPIVDSMVLAGTSVLEPAGGEVAWVASATYTLGARRVRSTTHRVYECVQAHSGRATVPEADPAYWLDVGPTQRWAPFDAYVSTAAATATSLVYELQPGYFNACAIYGLVGSSLTVSVLDGPGGEAIYSTEMALYADPAGWYEYLFLPAIPREKVVLTGFPLRPGAVLRIEVAGAQVAVGLIAVGDYRSIFGDVSEPAGVMWGASVEPVTYSYIKTNDDGTTRIVRRSSATGLRCNVHLPLASANYALSSVRAVLDVPVAWIGPNVAGLEGLNVFGLGSGSLVYDGPRHATLSLSVKGLI